MRAAGEHTLYFQVAADQDGLKLEKTKVLTTNEVANITDFFLLGDVVSYEGKYSDYVSDLTGVTIGYEVYAMTSTGSSLVASGTDLANQMLGNGLLADKDYTIVLSLEKVDVLTPGYAPSQGSDGADDYDQEAEVVTMKIEGWDAINGKGSGKYGNEVEVVVGKNYSVEKLAEDYADTKASGDDIYKLVFYSKGNTLTGKWEKDPSKTFVEGTPASESTPVYDELDTNHDGVVSCDEAHGEGWVWNEDKKACVYTGSTTSTVIVNTATR